MSERNKQACRRFYDEVMGRKDLKLAEEIMADGFVDHDPTPGFAPDKKGTIDSFRMTFAAFPDMSAEIHDMVAEGDKVATNVTFRGTHEGEYMGIPATGKGFEAGAVDIIRLDDEGRAVEHWGIFDAMSVMQQLGMLPPQG